MISMTDEFARLHARLDDIENKLDAHVLRHDVTRQVLIAMAKATGLTISTASVLAGIWRLFAH